MNRNWDVYANWGLGLGNTNWRLKLLSIHRGPGLLNTNWGLGATAVAEGQSQVPGAGKHINPENTTRFILSALLYIKLGPYQYIYFSNLYELTSLFEFTSFARYASGGGDFMQSLPFLIY